MHISIVQRNDMSYRSMSYIKIVVITCIISTVPARCRPHAGCGMVGMHSDVRWRRAIRQERVRGHPSDS